MYCEFFFFFFITCIFGNQSYQHTSNGCSATLTCQPNTINHHLNNRQHCLLECCRQLNICFSMSNLESDCSAYLPPGLDSLPTITSYSTYSTTYPVSCITAPQITVLGTMLTWHPSTEILSRLTACIQYFF